MQEKQRHTCTCAPDTRPTRRGQNRPCQAAIRHSPCRLSLSSSGLSAAVCQPSTAPIRHMGALTSATKHTSISPAGHGAAAPRCCCCCFAQAGSSRMGSGTDRLHGQGSRLCCWLSAEAQLSVGARLSAGAICWPGCWLLGRTCARAHTHHSAPPAHCMRGQRVHRGQGAALMPNRVTTPENYKRPGLGDARLARAAASEPP